MLKIEELDYKDNKEYIDKHFSKLLLDSYDYDRKFHNLREVDNLEQMFEALKTSTVFILIRQSKYVGFFINPVNHNKKSVGIKIFRYSRACPMSSRSLVKSALLRAIAYYINNQDEVVKTDFSVWHPALTHPVKAILPLLKLYTITSDYIECYYEFKKEEIPKLVLILTKYLGTDDIDMNNFNVVL